MVVDTLLGIADAISTILSFGTAKAAFVTVKNAIKKVGIKSLKAGAKKVADIFKDATLKKVLYNKAKAWLKDHAKDYAKDVGINFAWNTVCETMWKSWESKGFKFAEINEKDVISAVDVFNVSGIKANCDGNNPLGCAKNVMAGFSSFDPTGVLTIATAFMHPTCQVTTKDYRKDQDASDAIQKQYPKGFDPNDKSNCITLFSKCNFQGEKKEVCITQKGLGPFDNKTNSFLAGSKASGIIFEDELHGGRFITFHAGEANKCLSDKNTPEFKLAKMASSILFGIDCLILNYTPFSQQGKKTQNFVICDDKPNFNAFFTPDMKNVRAYSYTKKPIEVTLYQLPNYQGPSYTVKGGDSIDPAKLPFAIVHSVKIKRS